MNLYQITCKYPAKCAETGQIIQKGSFCLYNKATRQLYSETSQKFQNWQEEERARQFAKAWNMPDSNW